MIQEPSAYVFQDSTKQKPSRTNPYDKAYNPFGTLGDQDQGRKLLQKKKQSKNTMFLLDNKHQIQKIMKDIQQDIGNFIQVLQSPLQIIITQPKKNIDHSAYNIRFSQADFRVIKKYEKLLNHIDQSYKKLLKRILDEDRKADSTLPNFGQQNVKKLDKNIYQNTQTVNKQQFQFLKAYYAQDKEQKDLIPLHDVIHNIFEQVEFNIYFPTMVKVTIGGIQSMDKINQIADISLRIEVKVNVPGFSDSPKYYKKIFEKMSICLKAEDLSNQHNITVKFDKEYDDDSGISTSFEENPKQYYEKNYKWSQYKMSTVDIDEKFRNFEGFILVADLKNVKVKVTGDVYRSPFELLDLKGIIEIEQLNVYLEQIQGLFSINNRQIQDLILQANPKITMKFNLVIIYSRKNTELSPMILFNNITSYENIKKDGYSLATSLMFLETSNSRTSKYQLSKNPCHRRWRAKNINQALDRYEGLKKNYSFRPLLDVYKLERLEEQKAKGQKLQGKADVSMIGYAQKTAKDSSEIQTDLETLFEDIQLLNFRLQRKLDKSDLQKQIKSKAKECIHNLKMDQQKDHRKIQRRIDILRNIQFQLLKYQTKVKKDPLLHYLLMDLEMAQQSQIILLEFKKMYLSQKLKNDDIQQNERNQILLHFNQISQYLDTFNQKNWKIPTIRQYQHDDYFNNSKVHYHFPIYRHPGLSLFLLFITTNILGILNLFIFFQDPSFGGRLTSLATLLISFVGMIPVTQGIINSIKITLTEILIYLMMFTPLLCLGQSFYLKVSEAEANPLASPFFWLCVFISLLNIFVPLISILIFKCKEQPYYNKVKASILKSFEEVNLILPGSQKLSQNKYLKQGEQKKQRRTMPQILLLSIGQILTKLYSKMRSKQQWKKTKFKLENLNKITLEKVIIKKIKQV